MKVTISRDKGNYTVMSNHHLRNKHLSLKAKGLQSILLSLPETWSFSEAGLCTLSGDGSTATAAALRELEENKYLSRRIIREKGKYKGTEYIIFESPELWYPADKDTSIENGAQPSTERSIQQDNILAEKERFLYRRVIEQNLETDILQIKYPKQQDCIREILELVVESVCSEKKTVYISGKALPHPLVKERFLSLNSEHISYVLNCLERTQPQIHNRKQYLLAALYGAPDTMGEYYEQQVTRDLG